MSAIRRHLFDFKDKDMFTEYLAYADWLTKVALYLSLAAVIGGTFSYVLLGSYLELRKITLRYITVGAGAGFIASLSSFFILVGSFASTGISGLWDRNYINLLADTPVGYMLFLRSGVFALIFFFMFAVQLGKSDSQLSILQKSILAILPIPIILSFSQFGHVTNLPAFAQVLLSFHVLAMSLWMGALFPLWKTSRIIHGLALKERMHIFGRIAAFIVATLVGCGVSIALLLFEDMDTLLHTTYGHVFILKIAFVCGILLLAALNKWYFTPRLQDVKYAKQLSYAIVFEMMLGLSILLTTGYITTVVGIE